MALKQVAVSMPGGLPLGFRLCPHHLDPTLFSVSKIRQYSKAEKSGLKQEDVILAVNGICCENLSHLAITALTDISDILEITSLRNMTTPSEAREAFVNMAYSVRRLSNKEIAELTSNPNVIVARRQSTGCIQNMGPKENKPHLKLFGAHKFQQSSLSRSFYNYQIGSKNENDKEERSKIFLDKIKLEKQTETGVGNKLILSTPSTPENEIVNGETKTLPRKRERASRSRPTTERRHLISNRFKNIAQMSGINDMEEEMKNDMKKEVNLKKFEETMDLRRTCYNQAQPKEQFENSTENKINNQDEETRFQTKMDVNLLREELLMPKVLPPEQKSSVRRFSLSTPCQQVVIQKKNTLLIKPANDFNDDNKQQNYINHQYSQLAKRNMIQNQETETSLNLKSNFLAEEQNKNCFDQINSNQSRSRTTEKKTEIKNQLGDEPSRNLHTQQITPNKSATNLHIQSSSNKMIRPTRLRSNSISVISSTRSTPKIAVEKSNITSLNIKSNKFTIPNSVEKHQSESTNEKLQDVQNKSDILRFKTKNETDGHFSTLEYEASNLHSINQLSKNSNKIDQYLIQNSKNLNTSQYTGLVSSHLVSPNVEHNRQPMILSRKFSVPDNRTLERTKQNITMVTQTKKTNFNSNMFDTTNTQLSQSNAVLNVNCQNNPLKLDSQTFDKNVQMNNSQVKTNNYSQSPSTTLESKSPTSQQDDSSSFREEFYDAVDFTELEKPNTRCIKNNTLNEKVETNAEKLNENLLVGQSSFNQENLNSQNKQQNASTQQHPSNQFQQLFNQPSNQQFSNNQLQNIQSQYEQILQQYSNKMNQINYSHQYQQQNPSWQQQQNNPSWQQQQQQHIVQQFQTNFLSGPQRAQAPQQVLYHLNSPNINQQIQQTQQFQEKSDNQSNFFHNQSNQSFQQKPYQQNIHNFQQNLLQQQQNLGQQFNSNFSQQRPQFQHNYQPQQNTSLSPSHNMIPKPYSNSSNDSPRSLGPPNNYFSHPLSNNLSPNLVFNGPSRSPNNIYNGNFSLNQYGFLQGNHLGNSSPTHQFKNISSPNSPSSFNHQNSSISNNFHINQTVLQQQNFSRPHSAVQTSLNHPQLSSLTFNRPYSQVIQNQSQLNPYINDQRKFLHSPQFNQSPGFSQNINPSFASHNNAYSFSPNQNNNCNNLINDPNSLNKSISNITNNNANYQFDNIYPSPQNNFNGSNPGFNKDSSQYTPNHPSSYDSFFNYNKTN